jgi:hypothetical protein
MVAGDKPAVAEMKSTRTAAREAFFLDFAKETRKRFPNLVLMLTGGFRSRAGAEAAIKENACDLVGIARPAAVNPRFAALLLDEDTSNEDAQISLDRVKPGLLPRLLRSRILGAGAETVSFISIIYGSRKLETHGMSNSNRLSMRTRFVGWPRDCRPLPQGVDGLITLHYIACIFRSAGHLLQEPNNILLEIAAYIVFSTQP